MKRRGIVLLLSMSLAVTMTACGSSSGKAMKALEERAQEVSGIKEPETDTGEEAPEAEETEQKKKPEQKEADNPQQKQVKHGEVMLGDDCAGYDGFKYLEEMPLQIDYAGANMLTVFLPESDYMFHTETSASSSKAGVSVNIESNPYTPYGLENAAAEDILQELTEHKYDSFGTYEREDIIIGRATVPEDGTAVIDTSYTTYNYYDETFSVYQVTSVWKRTDDYVLQLDIEVDTSEANEKTQGVVEELESFYGVPIYFDTEEAAAKTAAYEQDEEFMHTKSNATGYAILDLPRSWERVYDLEDYDVSAFTEGGELEGSNSMVLTAQKFQSEDLEEGAETDAKKLMELAEDAIGIPWGSASVTERQGTCMGDVLEITGSSCDIMEGASFRADVMYYDGYIYYVAAVQTQDAEEDAFAWLDNFLENGKFDFEE